MGHNLKFIKFYFIDRSVYINIILYTVDLCSVHILYTVDLCSVGLHVQCQYMS